MTKSRFLFISAALALACCSLFASEMPAGDQPYGGVRLLEGYKYKRSGGGGDTINGLIYKDNGLSIEFESGLSEGYAADPKKKDQYTWYREQVVNGHKIMVALTRWSRRGPAAPSPGRY
jgi:hypothetical protein